MLVNENVMVTFLVTSECMARGVWGRLKASRGSLAIFYKSQEHALSSLFLQKVGIWWRWLDSHQRPHGYEPCALTNCAPSP